MDIKSRFIIGIVVLNIFMLGYMLIVCNLGINNLNIGLILARYQVAQDYEDVETSLSIEQESMTSSELVIKAENNQGEVLTEARINFLIPVAIFASIVLNLLMLIIFFFRRPVMRWLKITN